MAKILVIEDQDAIVKMLKSRLKSQHHDVDVARDGQEGMDKIKKKKFDLIVTDLAMPRMNGNVVVRILKMSEEHKRIPIIMLSAFVNEKMGDGVEIPADHYMPKPFEAETLIKAVNDLLAKHPPS